MTRRRFALDQNFPTPIVEALKKYVPYVDLVSIRGIGKVMERLDDWEVLEAGDV